MKRSLALLLVLLLAVSLLPAAARADSVCPGSKTGKHAWSQWRTVTQPTCTESGVKTRRCSACRRTERQTIPAVGHSWDEGALTREPQGLHPGERTFTCLRCKQTRTEPVDPTVPLFGQMHGAAVRSPEANPLRITEQPQDGYASRRGDGNYLWTRLSITVEGGQAPYTYVWYYKPIFGTLGAVSDGATVSDLVSWKTSGITADIARIQGRTRPAASEVTDRWLKSHGLTGVSLAGGASSSQGTPVDSVGWGGRVVGGQMSDGPHCEARSIGQYYCVVTDELGQQVTSRLANVTESFHITEQPQDASLFGRTSVELRCAVAGGSGNYEFVLLDHGYDGESESDDAGVVGRCKGTEASLPVTKPGTYVYWVDDLGAAQAIQSRIVRVVGDPLTDQPQPPQPGADTTAAAYEGDLTGDWYAEIGGMVLQIVLNGDGTYEAAFMDQPESGKGGTWAFGDGGVCLDGSPTPELLLEGDELCLWAFESVLTREAPSVYVPGEPAADQALESYQGRWLARHMAVNGVILSADALDEPVNVYIEGTDGAFTGGLFGDAVAAMTFESGALTLREEGMSLSLQLQQDGLLRLTVDDDGALVLYLVRAAE